MPAQYEAVVKDWPEKAQQVCRTVVEAHGPPHEATASRLIWHNTGPWKRMELYKDPAHHNWPNQHDDVLESVIEYYVPPDRVGDLALFDGAVTYRGTRGELSATCEAEEANFLAINLAHEILVGERSVAEARRAYAEHMRRKQAGESPRHMTRLLFDLPTDRKRDEDKATLDDEGERERSEEQVLASRRT